MKVVALDLATSTGVAVGSSGSTPRAWTVHLGKRSEEERFSRVQGLTDYLIEKYQPDLIAIEAAIGGKNSSQFLVGLVACVRGRAFTHETISETFYLASIRKHFLGKAFTTRDFPSLSKPAAKKAIKAQVIARCGLLKWEVDGDDSADALALWDYACAVRSPKYQAKPQGGLFR